MATAIIAIGPGLGGCLTGWANEAERFIKPVDAPITRRYEQPSGPYAPGHRGIDFEVPVGTPVVASNGGTVSFAGPVAHDGLFVTIDHANGLQTT
ncbi:MAG: M23 family metallopeptidase, partial [Actinomycetota bacterium]